MCIMLYQDLGQNMEEQPNWTQVVATSSIDFDCIVGWRKSPIGYYCGELFVVSQNFADPSLSKDDGYVITHFHDELSGFLELFVLDTRN